MLCGYIHEGLAWGEAEVCCAWGDEWRNFCLYFPREKVCLIRNWQALLSNAGRHGCTRSQVLLTNSALVLSVCEYRWSGRTFFRAYSSLILTSMELVPGDPWQWVFLSKESTKSEDETHRWKSYSCCCSSQELGDAWKGPGTTGHRVRGDLWCRESEEGGYLPF